MNKLIPFKKYSKNTKELDFLAHTSVVVDEKNTPLGFVFGRDAFISLLEYFDENYEKSAIDRKLGHDNPAGRLIDLIEEKLPLNPDFVKELKTSVKKTKKQDWIPMDELIHSLNV